MVKRFEDVPTLSKYTLQETTKQLNTISKKLIAGAKVDQVLMQQFCIALFGLANLIGRSINDRTKGSLSATKSTSADTENP